MPLMYVNSSSYAAPTMVTSGTFGHQVTHNGTSPAPPGAYMAPTLVPNLVFRQNVPVRMQQQRLSSTNYYGTVDDKKRFFEIGRSQRAGDNTR